MTDVLSPCAGRVIAMVDVPDPVFAEEMVGPGVAIEPAAGPVTVVSPIAGKVLKVMPHAFVVMGDGVGVLVHLGINTVRLDGEGFEVVAEQGSEVAAGDPMITWDPSALPATAGGQDVSPVVPVVLMDAPKGSVSSDAIGGDVVAGDLLFGTA
ncbi:PTS system N-acetylglucosamine-specific IIA component, Glc family [Nocardioides exalbidus]|uniref:PTS system N-acetylglucosamine-specific IIA component, Glc family n=1 Tax=Nocardioides exalbidus TaxID=402596 RepID=A0A1H4K5R9_9ACTN|nr:PTS glucose transporter subunit IIA [Nocardioides exalbidus]SEB53763.1 PTS system N-acetylglucosamine-specific IIA component, Glc family [Nocardioides exalbidus]